MEAVRTPAEAGEVLGRGGAFDLALISTDGAAFDVPALVETLRARTEDMPVLLIGGEGPVRGDVRYLVEGDERVVLVTKPFGVTRLEQAIDELTRPSRDGSEVTR